MAICCGVLEKGQDGCSNCRCKLIKKPGKDWFVCPCCEIEYLPAEED